MGGGRHNYLTGNIYPSFSGGRGGNINVCGVMKVTPNTRIDRGNVVHQARPNHFHLSHSSG